MSLYWSFDTLENLTLMRRNNISDFDSLIPGQVISVHDSCFHVNIDMYISGWECHEKRTLLKTLEIMSYFLSNGTKYFPCSLTNCIFIKSNCIKQIVSNILDQTLYQTKSFHIINLLKDLLYFLSDCNLCIFLIFIFL